MEDESAATRSIIDGPHFSDIQRDEISIESDVSRKIIDEFNS